MANLLVQQQVAELVDLCLAHLDQKEALVHLVVVLLVEGLERLVALERLALAMDLLESLVLLAQ